MPPRFAYWTILIDNAPTAFRARDREELLPTLTQLKRKNQNAEMKWFAQGRLWESPEAQHASWREQKPAGERRDRDWRPGGEHKDPRARFDKEAQRRKKREQRAAWNAEPRPRFGQPPSDAVKRDREKLGPPPHTPRDDRTRRDRQPTGGGWKDRPPRESQPAGAGWKNRPPRDRQATGAGWKNRPPGNRPASGEGWKGRPPREGGWTPKGPGGPGSDRPWQTKPTGPRAQRKPWQGRDRAPREGGWQGNANSPRGQASGGGTERPRENRRPDYKSQGGGWRPKAANTDRSTRGNSPRPHGSGGWPAKQPPDPRRKRRDDEPPDRG
jgi:hypothetical protein